MTPIVGKEPKERLHELYDLIMHTRIPLYLVGPSGSGKTATGKALCKAYALSKKTPAYYVQLSKEETKSTMLIGYRLDQGSLVPMKGVLARAAEEKAIVFVDEITHSTHNMLLMLNAFDGAESTITIGDMHVDASDLKIIYGSNNANHAGNIRVPQSFANRVHTIAFDYPPFEDEIEIAKAVANKDYLGVDGITLPETFFRYITNLIDKHRSDVFPLSVRNVSKAVLHLQRLYMRALRDNNGILPQQLDSYFTKSGATATRQRLGEYLLKKKIDDVDQLVRQPEIREFMLIISAIGVEKFRDVILSAFGYHVSMEGMELDEQKFKTELRGGVI